MSATLPRFLLALLACGTVAAEPPKGMPKQDVVDVPAIAAGLCVSNAFQTNMVLQRDKPLKIWGWAAPGEQVTVACAGQLDNATAGADRSWQVTLKPMSATSTTQTLTVKGRDATLTRGNNLVGEFWVLGGQAGRLRHQGQRLPRAQRLDRPLRGPRAGRDGDESAIPHAGRARHGRG